MLRKLHLADAFRAKRMPPQNRSCKQPLLDHGYSSHPDEAVTQVTRTRAISRRGGYITSRGLSVLPDDKGSGPILDLRDCGEGV